MAITTEKSEAFVKTNRERCRVCYTCVRECPAKAIRIEDGQAEVVASRCIACGNCVKVCSQNAKQAISGKEAVEALLSSAARVAACVAPSFPADFPDFDYREFVGMLRQMGFDLVTEVSFGADLVAERYRRLMTNKDSNRYIATTCPAVVAYVERYHPGVVKNLAPIVSPMIASSRVLHKEHGDDLKIVFVGPCIAKKMEASEPRLKGEVDAVITFTELKEMFQERQILASECESTDFDPPHPGLGALFPLNRGMLQAADISEDLLEGDVVSADGLSEFVTAISEFADNNLDSRLLEVLSCEGCIMGPGMSTLEPKFRRRSRVSQYARFRGCGTDKESHNRNMDKYASLTLERNYNVFDQRLAPPSAEELKSLLKRLGKNTKSDELNCGACGYHTCMEHAIAIHKGLAEDEMCLPYVIDKLKTTVSELSVSHARLATTQDQLMQSEKLASMGQLAAGVAHELNNPLGVVLMYSHLLLDEISGESEFHEDIKRIADQAQRGKKIVSNLLDFARENKVLREEVDIEQHVKSMVSSVSKPANVELEFCFTHENPKIEMDPDQMTQVFTNIASNAYAAMPDGGKLTIVTSEKNGELQVKFIDTGQGISEKNIGRIFQPFFTTKKLGKGTGLGLAVSYGIVKMHRGSIQVESNCKQESGSVGTVFTVCLPRHIEMF